MPAIPADYGYGIQQTGPSRFAAESPDHTEHLNISQLPDGKWLYHDQNHADNNADFIHILPRGGGSVSFSWPSYRKAKLRSTASQECRTRGGNVSDSVSDALFFTTPDAPEVQFLETIQ